MSVVEVQRRIQNTILRIPKKDYISKLNSAKKNIISLLKIREDTEFITSWNSFFDSIPVVKEVVHQSYENIMRSLSIVYGGHMLKERNFTTFKR